MANGYPLVVYQPQGQVVEGQYRELSAAPRQRRSTYRVRVEPTQQSYAPPPRAPKPPKVKKPRVKKQKTPEELFREKSIAVGKWNEKRWKQEQKLQERQLKVQAKADAKMARRNRRPSAFARKNKRIAKRIWRRLI